MMKYFNTPKQACPGCGAANDATTGIADRSRPKKGDVSICFYCGHISVFNADKTRRDPTSDEMHAIAGDKNILRVQEARAKINIKPPQKKERA